MYSKYGEYACKCVALASCKKQFQAPGWDHFLTMSSLSVSQVVQSYLLSWLRVWTWLECAWRRVGVIKKRFSIRCDNFKAGSCAVLFLWYWAVKWIAFWHSENLISVLGWFLMRLDSFLPCRSMMVKWWQKYDKKLMRCSVRLSK